MMIRTSTELGSGDSTSKFLIRFQVPAFLAAIELNYYSAFSTKIVKFLAVRQEPIVCSALTHSVTAFAAFVLHTRVAWQSAFSPVFVNFGDEAILFTFEV